MRYCFSAAVLFCAMGSVCAADEIKGSDLFPLSVGKRWTYRIQGQDNLTITVTDVEKIGGFPCYRLEGRQRGTVVATEHLSIRADGVYRMRFDSADFDPSLPICKFPPASDQTWKLDYKIADKKASISFETETEEITVPAGKYKTVVVHSVVPEGTGQLKNSCWYAPKVGMVKQQIESDDGKIVLELERERPEKKGPMPK
jgi:hypothetical protein